MDQLRHKIDELRGKLDALRRHDLKETPTRTIVIDPLLEALGWDVRDPDEVQLEYPTVDGKSVDYALKINKKPVLLVEAKPLGDSLTDVKAITQVVGYAANDGVDWCVLTNGVKWQVYRSVEKCPAPEKLMFEVPLDPNDSGGMQVHQLASQLWRISRDEMAKGTLDGLGERTFTDGKVRKALNSIMHNPPRQFLNLIRATSGDNALSPQRIKESLQRVAGGQAGVQTVQKAGIEPAPKRVKSSQYDEDVHTSRKPQEVIALYRAIDQICLSLKPGAIEKHYLAKTVNYIVGKHIFCCVHIQQGGLRVWLKLKLGRTQNPPDFARDVSSIGHWGVGDLELGINNLSQAQLAEPLIRASFAGGR